MRSRRLRSAGRSQPTTRIWYRTASGFLDSFGTGRIGCVRLADNDGTVEVHMIPGEGNIDFADMFRRLEGSGYEGHYTMAYGSPDEKIASREWLIGQAGAR